MYKQAYTAIFDPSAGIINADGFSYQRSSTRNFLYATKSKEAEASFKAMYVGKMDQDLGTGLAHCSTSGEPPVVPGAANVILRLGPCDRQWVTKDHHFGGGVSIGQ